MGELLLTAIGRSDEMQARYVQHLREKAACSDTSCDLCNSIERQQRDDLYPMLGDKAIILTNKLFTLIDNDFPYNNYDGQNVTRHCMIVPRLHIDFDSAQNDVRYRHELADAKYEAAELTDHYFTTNMERTSTSFASSIQTHGHTHLFRTDNPIIEQHFSIAEGYNKVKFSSK